MNKRVRIANGQGFWGDSIDAPIQLVEGGDIDQGNAEYGGQEVLVYFDDVFIPHEHVFMDGEYEFAQDMVARFTAYHRASYVWKWCT